MTPCTSAAPFSAWHRVVEQGWPQYVPWWVAVEYEWQEWTWKNLKNLTRPLQGEK